LGHRHGKDANSAGYANVTFVDGSVVREPDDYKVQGAVDRGGNRMWDYTGAFVYFSGSK
jgi:prepilin-type processing-associated H-X9-DG protein